MRGLNRLVGPGVLARGRVWVCRQRLGCWIPAAESAGRIRRAESTGRVGLLDLACRVLVRVHKQDLECRFCLVGCWIRVLSLQAGSGVLGVGAAHSKGPEKEEQGSDLLRLKKMRGGKQEGRTLEAA